MKLRSVVLFCQLVLTLFIISQAWAGALKLALLLGLWCLTFFPLNRYEILIFIFVSLLYSFGNFLSIQKSVFFFKYPDFLGMPFYEFAMWGFYFFHSIRVLEPRKVPKLDWKTMPLAMIFSSAFSLSGNPLIVPAITICALGLLVIFYHEKEDLRFASYFVLLGMLLEILGVLSDQWGYPDPYKHAVAPWFFCLFAGSGILCNRIALPLLRAMESKGLLFWRAQ